MSKPKNPAIGTVPCPFAGCSHTCEVRRFGERAKSEGARRWAGKLYGDCPDHGRFGQDCRPAMQEFMLEKATLWGPDGKPGGTDPAPEKSAVREPQPPTQATKPRPVVMPPAPIATARAAPVLDLFKWGK